MQQLPYTFPLLPTQNCQLVTWFAPSKPSALSILQYNIIKRIAGHLLGNSGSLTCHLFSSLRGVSHYSPFSSINHIFLVPYFYLFRQL